MGAHGSLRTMTGRVARVLLLTLALALLLASPALAKSYSMLAVDVVADVQPNGDIRVTESRTFEFDGDYTFVVWKLNTQSELGSFVIDVTGMGVDGVQHTHTMDASAIDVRPDGGYQITDYGSYLEARVFFRKSDTQSVVTLDYIIRGGALRWDDTSELYWQFIGDETDLPSDDVNVRINLPPEVERPDVKAWAHGPLTGVVTINDDATVDLTVDRLPEYTFVEARVLFPREALPNAPERLGARYQHVLDEEAQWAEEANAERMRARVLVWLASIIAILVPIGVLAVNGIMFMRYGKEYDTQFQGEYFRELPADLSPAVVSTLLTWGTVSDDALAATLMDLINRGAISIEPVTEQKSTMLGLSSKEEQTYRLTYVHEKANQLSDQEQRLAHHLFTTVAKKSAFTLAELQALAKEHPQSYVNGINDWKKAVQRESKKHRFVEGGVGKQALAFLLAVLAAFAGFAPVFVGANGFLLIFALPMAIAAGGFAVFMRRRAPHANEMHAKYRALEKYLKDFGRLDEKPPTHVVLWEHFLVLAVVFGIADEVIESLRIKAPEVLEDPGIRTAYWMAYPAYGGVSPINSVKSGMVSAASVASSQMSSSSGGGGGFSGGGGGGGGGGGVSAG